MRHILATIKIVVSFLSLTTSQLTAVFAYPGYGMLVPNGDRVPNPCDHSSNWVGIGHQSPDGGGKLNRFGLDFLQMRRIWTVALCQMDSDGDGMTNGEELGDPNCQWHPAAPYLPPITDRRYLSHPGICEPFDSKRCAGKNGFLLAICPEKLLLAKKCSGPTSPKHSYISHYTMASGADQYSVGDYIQFECDEGYVMSGDYKTYCQQNGTWTHLPVCHYYGTVSASTCPPPRTMPVNSYVSSSPEPSAETGYYAVGSVFQYECNSGFRASGYGSITCLQSGDWSVLSLECTVAEDIAAAALNVRRSPNSRLNEFPSAAQMMMSCQMPPVLPPAINAVRGLKADGRYAPGDVVTLGCQPGYNSEGCPYTMCQDNGNFTMIMLSCKLAKPLITCAPPTVPANAQISAALSGSQISPGGYYTIGNSVTFICNPGYVAKPSNTAPAICQQDGTWFTCSLDCQPSGPAPVACDSPSVPLNARRLPISSAPGPDNRFKVGDIIMYECNDDFNPVGNSLVRCQASGSWTQLTFSCQAAAPLTCSMPPIPPNGRMLPVSSIPTTGNRYRPGDAILYDCVDGYTVYGNSQINCQTDGTWSPLTFNCQSQQPGRTCREPILPPNSCAIQGPTGPVYYPSDTIILACNFGYTPGGSSGRLTGSAQITCQSNGQWSATDFYCESVGIFTTPTPFTLPMTTRPPAASVCEAPDLPTYSTMMKNSRAGNLGSDTFVEGDYVQYSCQNGYTIYGTIQCQADGSWSSASMTCQSISRGILSLNSRNNQPGNGGLAGGGSSYGTCAPPRTPSNATPLSSSPVYSTGEFIQYSCLRGYAVSGVMTCLRDGTWSASVFVCESSSLPTPPPIPTTPPSMGRVTCLGPTVPENAQTIAQLVTTNGDTSFPVGAFFVFLCNDGYHMVGDPTIICNTDGRWTESPFCFSDTDTAY